METKHPTFLNQIIDKKSGVSKQLRLEGAATIFDECVPKEQELGLEGVRTRGQDLSKKADRALIKKARRRTIIIQRARKQALAQ